MHAFILPCWSPKWEVHHIFRAVAVFPCTHCFLYIYGLPEGPLLRNEAGVYSQLIPAWSNSVAGNMDSWTLCITSTEPTQIPMHERIDLKAMAILAWHTNQSIWCRWNVPSMCLINSKPRQLLLPNIYVYWIIDHIKVGHCCNSIFIWLEGLRDPCSMLTIF